MLSQEQKAEIVKIICGIEAKTIAELLDLDLDKTENEINLFLQECQDTLTTKELE